MSLTYTDYANRAEWLKGRAATIGASEAACILGMGFMSPDDLYREKTGKPRAAHKSGSENHRIAYGTAAEEHLRGLFALQFAAKYQMAYHPFRVYINDRHPHMSCTLDGEIASIDGRRGIWECKTAWIMRKSDADEWNSKLPQKYYIQLLAQLAVTEYDFAVLTAQLIYPDGASEIKHFPVQAAEVKADMEYLACECEKFYRDCIMADKPPKTLLTL